MISVRHYLQKSLYGVSTVQECWLIFLVVKIELKRVFKVPILVIIDAAVLNYFDQELRREGWTETAVILCKLNKSL